MLSATFLCMPYLCGSITCNLCRFSRDFYGH
nr:MAG TPA: hypothetical protein [Caudoviricetes sp.]